MPDKNITVAETWDGYCWLEFSGLIADISIGRKMATEKVSEEFVKFLKVFNSSFSRGS